MLSPVPPVNCYPLDSVVAEYTLFRVADSARELADPGGAVDAVLAGAALAAAAGAGHCCCAVAAPHTAAPIRH